MWPVLRHEEILRLQQQPKSATSTISTNREESRTMRSAETQTELLDCESSSSCGEAEVDGDRGSSEEVGSGIGEDEKVEIEVEEELEDDEDEDSLGEESKLKSIKRLGCSNLFNFNKLELLNERCSGGVMGPQQQQISDSSRNLCEHEVHVAIDDDLTTTTGEGKRTTMAIRTAVLGGGDDSGSCSSIIFIQESPEVIL